MKYFLGHEQEELERLAFQALVLNGVTARLIEKTGLGEGMRVLDIGCGPGDVALLAAQKTGISGQVVGIDSSAAAIAQASSRAVKGKHRGIVFKNVGFDDFTDPMPFDLVIARYVLIHQPDPAAFVRKAATLLRPGGVIAFHEIAFQTPMLESHPTVELWDQAGRWIAATMRLSASHYDVATRLLGCFNEAGLAVPELFAERHVGGGENSYLYRWAAETLQSMVPHLIAAGQVTQEDAELNGYEGRLREATMAANSQLLGPLQICAWLKLAGK